MTAESDACLVAATRRGDRDAFGRVVEKYQRAVFAVAFSTVREHALADDIAQDTFITAWHRLDELRDARRLPAWLCGIARNHARDARKRRLREQPPIDVPDPSTPFDASSDAETARVLAAALDQVPDAYREPLVLFYFEDRSVGAVARALGISEAATHQRLSRGRKYLTDRVTALADRDLARRGPKRELAAAVLGALMVSTSEAAAKGTLVPTKLMIATTILVTAGTAAGVMSTDAARITDPVTAARAPIPWRSTSTTAPPALAMTPDCSAAASHMADLLQLPILAEHYATKCERDHWSDNVRLCIVAAETIERATIDCSDESPATQDEVAGLPPELRCGALATHAYALATGPDGKYTRFKQKLADTPKRAAQIDRMALVLRDAQQQECDERPWSVERRKCVAAATTFQAYGACQ